MSQGEDVKEILRRYRVVAIVGLSKDAAKDSYRVAEYLKENGYRIVPINPSAASILGEKSYPSLLELPIELQRIIDIVDIFRPAAEVPAIVQQVVQMRRVHQKPEVVWMQLGIENAEAAAEARKAGIAVVMNRCMMQEHKHFMAQDDEELEQLKARKLRELMTEKKGGSTAGGVPVAVDDSTFDQFVQKDALVVIDFWAAWCGPCRMISPVVEELARDYAGKVVFGKLNVDENPETAARFNVVGIPTLLFVKKGVEVDRVVGAVPKEHIELKLKQHLGKSA